MFLKWTVSNWSIYFCSFSTYMLCHETKSFGHFVISNVQQQIRNELTKVFIKTSRTASNEVPWTRHSVHQIGMNNVKIIFALGVYKEGS